MVVPRRRRLILGADLGIRLLESAGCRFECVKSDFRNFGERYEVASCYLWCRVSGAPTQLKRHVCGKLKKNFLFPEEIFLER